jgi:hypothetical protein
MSIRFATRLPVIGLVLVAILCSSALGNDRFVSVSWSGLRFEGNAPDMAANGADDWRRFLEKWPEPWVVLDGGGETFLHRAQNGSFELSFGTGAPSGVSMRVSDDAPLKGRLFLPARDSASISIHRFEVATPDADVDARKRFYEDMEAHYAHLLLDDAPGAAWFRHRRDEARRVLGRTDGEAMMNGRVRDPADALDLFTGARAVAENLDLDRNLRVATAAEATVDIESLAGVTTRAYDWKHLVEGKKPELDPLAKLVPMDQHAVFFPTFDAMTRVFDAVDAQGTPLLEFFSARVEDFRTKERYQEQMLLPLTTLGRTLGPAVVSSVAVTGSDPFLVGGTDIVLLFDCKQPMLLETLLAARRADAEKLGAKHVEGDVGGVHYVGSLRSDRTVSSFTARFGSTVVVTNSLVALARVAAAAQDAQKSLLSADEYVWFRDRYARTDAKESALLVLTDATIRRWAGPRSRIGDARRLHAAAAMAEIQARHMDELVAGTIEEGKPAADADFPISADFVWGKDGVRSPIWGSLRSLTPLCELSVDKVSPAEKQAYEGFRAVFQTRWRYFDPIAVRFEVDGKRLRADATIRPLTIDSEYKEIDDFTRGAELPPHAGDPHESTLFHFALGFNKTSEIGHLFARELDSSASRFGADPLAWLGTSVALYAERDPWWDKVREAREADEPDDIDWYRVPVAVQIAVKDPLKLAGFLTALRTFADQSAPNLTKWENRTWQEMGYVRIAASEDLGMAEPGRDAALYYVPLPDALVLSPREDLIQHAIDRWKARKAGQPIAGAERNWLGASAGLRIDQQAIDAIDRFDRGKGPDRAAKAAWSALPILDEWKRRYPTQDPLALHERCWGVRLVSPGGGAFAWNEGLQAMESTNHGRPGAPKKSEAGTSPLGGIESAELGLTFEEQGLRAVVQIERPH